MPDRPTHPYRSIPPLPRRWLLAFTLTSLLLISGAADVAAQAGAEPAAGQVSSPARATSPQCMLRLQPDDVPERC